MLGDRRLPFINMTFCHQFTLLGFLVAAAKNKQRWHSYLSPRSLRPKWNSFSFLIVVIVVIVIPKKRYLNRCLLTDVLGYVIQLLLFSINSSSSSSSSPSPLWKEVKLFKGLYRCNVILSMFSIISIGGLVRLPHIKPLYKSLCSNL